MHPAKHLMPNRTLRLTAAALFGLGLVLTPSALAVPRHPDPPFGSEAATQIEVVVKFKDDRTVKGIVDSFWTDASAAGKRFDEFKRAHPDLAGATLVRVTYSNELVLAFPISPQGGNRRIAARDLTERLGRLPYVAYAEPDHTVSTQGP
jgi:hypothetical protein